MKRIVLLLAMLAMLAMLATPAMAEDKIDPKCHGQVVSSWIVDDGYIPPELVDSAAGEYFGWENAGDWNKYIEDVCP